MKSTHGNNPSSNNIPPGPDTKIEKKLLSYPNNNAGLAPELSPLVKYAEGSDDFVQTKTMVQFTPHVSGKVPYNHAKSFPSIRNNGISYSKTT